MKSYNMYDLMNEQMDNLRWTCMVACWFLWAIGAFLMLYGFFRWHDALIVVVGLMNVIMGFAIYPARKDSDTLEVR